MRENLKKTVYYQDKNPYNPYIPYNFRVTKQKIRTIRYFGHPASIKRPSMRCPSVKFPSVKSMKFPSVKSMKCPSMKCQFMKSPSIKCPSIKCASMTMTVEHHFVMFDPWGALRQYFRTCLILSICLVHHRGQTSRSSAVTERMKICRDM